MLDFLSVYVVVESSVVRSTICMFCSVENIFQNPQTCDTARASLKRFKRHYEKRAIFCVPHAKRWRLK
jgi:hypothetical protein